MDHLEALATWLTVLVAAWTVVTGYAGAAHDRRLAESGGRGLHAAAALMLLALAARAMGLRADLAGESGGGSWLPAVRELWTLPAADLVLWTAGLAGFAAVAALVVSDANLPARTRAHRVAGGVVAVVSLVAASVIWSASRITGGSEALVPLMLHHEAGVAARLLYVAACSSALVPLALVRAAGNGPVAAHAGTTARALRWLYAALAGSIAAVVLGAWLAYGRIAPPGDITPSGDPVDPTLTTLDALPLLPIALLAAAAYALSAAPRAASRRTSSTRWAACLLVAAAAIVALGILVPPVVDWTRARPLTLGAPLAGNAVLLVIVPLLVAVSVLAAHHLREAALPAWMIAAAAAGGAAVVTGFAALAGTHNGIALGAAAAAGAGVSLLVTGAVRARSRGGLAALLAQACAVMAIGCGAVAFSAAHTDVELAPGVPATVSAGGRDAIFTSQGTSQDEGPGHRGALVGFEIVSGNTRHFAAAGERVYLDAHGHSSARAAVPGIVRGIAGDLRFAVRGLRGESALVRVRHHPLVTPAWIAAGLTVLALLAAAAGGRPDAHADRAGDLSGTRP